MEVMPFVGFALASALLALTLRQVQPQWAMLVSLVAGICLIIGVLSRLGEVVDALSGLAQSASLSGTIWPLLLRILGVSALIEIGSQLCRDAGEAGIAVKVEMGGKLMVLSMSLPVMLALVDLILSIVP